MKKRLLFVISNTSIGGPQKSLLALFDKINYDLFEIDLLVLKPGGQLVNSFNERVKVLPTPELLTAITIPNKKIVWTILVLLKNTQFTLLWDVIISILRHMILKKNMNQERQKLWDKHNDKITMINGEYDMAFGILGLSTYAIVDLVNSHKKYHWIRSDTRILQRNESIDAKYFKKLNGFLAVSNETAKIFESMYPFSMNKMNVIYNYIPHTFYEKLHYDKQMMQTDKETIKLLTISRLDPLKGLDLAINAGKIIIDKGYKIKWFFLGDGKFRREVEHLIEKNGLQEQFVLLGFQMNTLSFIKDADIVVHPSRTEGKSNAVDEAKFIGKPIVVTRYDTVKEQITDGTTGVISELDGLDLAKKIEEVINDKNLQNFLVKNCLAQQEQEINPNDFFLNLYMNEGK